MPYKLKRYLTISENPKDTTEPVTNYLCHAKNAQHAYEQTIDAYPEHTVTDVYLLILKTHRVAALYPINSPSLSGPTTTPNGLN